MKTLKIKRIFVYTIYNGLRTMPPKDYPTTGEIKTTITEVLPNFKSHLEAYLGMMKEAEEIGVKMEGKEITKEEQKKLIDEINVKWKAYNKEHGNDIIDLPFSQEAFDVLNTQFNRDGWGNHWVVLVEEFGELLAAFEEAKK